jgi:hypothetical protein
MKYTKQQAEMLFLLVMMACAVVVLSFLYLIKPGFEAMAKSRKELKKTEAEIAKMSDATVALARAKNEKDTLTETIQRGERAIFSGLETDPPLYRLCVMAATKSNIKPAYGKETLKQALEFADKNPEGKEITRHYDEVRRTLDVSSEDFFGICRFLSAVEKASEGLSVQQLEIYNKGLDPQDEKTGKVNAKLELSMLGIREGGGGTESIDVSGAEDFKVGEKRSPFSPPGSGGGVLEDPLADLKRRLAGMKITGMWSDTLLVQLPESGTGEQVTHQNATLYKGELSRVGRTRVRWVAVSGDTFVFEVPDHGVRLRLITKGGLGDIITIKEEEAK